MNTSFPSAASDFAALLAGGKQSTNNSQFKGMLASLGCAKPAATGSASAARKDFDELLDAPGEPATSMKSASTTPDSAPSVLAGEPTAALTVTLQIKGMLGGRFQSASSEEGEVARDLTGEGETPTDPQVVVGELASAPLGGVGSVPAETAATGTLVPTKDAAPAREIAREIKLAPGRGHSLRGHGWNHALIQHTGICGKSSVTPKAETPVVPVSPPVVGCTASLASPVASVSPDSIIGAIVGLTIPLDFGTPAVASGDELVETVPADSSVVNEDLNSVPTNHATVLAEPTTIAANPTTVLVNPITVPADQAAVSPSQIAVTPNPTNVETNPVTVLPPNTGAAQTFPLIDVSTAVPVAPVLSVEKPEATAVVPDSSVPDATVPVTPELRREVVETVAAMLAPFFMNLPVVQPEMVPANSGGPAGDVLLAGGRAQSNLTITVKIGEQSRFSFELPQASLSEAKTTGLLAATIPSDESEQRPVPAPTAFHLPANLDHPADDVPSLDFRVQLKAVIEAAWQRSEQPDVGRAATVQPVPVADEMALPVVPAIASPIAPVSPLVMAEKIPAKQIEIVATELSQPVIDAPAPVTSPENPAVPVEVMVKLPGFGVVTAQIVASDNAGSSLLKKPGVGLGRAEKNAADSKLDRTKVSERNLVPEKTFLTTGTQPLKREFGNAGTAVAISDDTMPASFTSRRVTVDQLEFPPRSIAREIQPMLGRAENFADISEAPMATTPAPVLAHRAVETILNVVDAQRQSSANASSVNLHFKFGGDDLAVRVQMRGGEVVTQFLTDSAELRSALSKEWQTMAGQGGAAGLRMSDPIIAPASAGASSGFGSMAQGQNQARQQAQQQQQEHAAMVMPELHTFRRAAAVTAPKTEAAPRVSFAPATSQHLTATA